MSSTGASIDVEGAGRRFSDGGEEVWAVRDVSMRVEPGEFVAIIGRSGSGKTTLLNLIAGLDRPTHGSVRIDGQDVGGFSERQLTELRRRRIGFIFQSFGLLPLLSALENVELALRIAGATRRERGRRAHEVLELMGLAGRAEHRPYELSGGEQQRVAIARAIANRPALVLADEPTAELDSNTAVTIFRLLRDVGRAEGTTIVTSTHDHMVVELADRVEEMADGRLLAPESRTLLDYITARSAASAKSALHARDAEPTPDEALEPPAPIALEVREAAPSLRDEAVDERRWAPPERR